MTIKSRGWYYTGMEVYAKTEDKTPVKPTIQENKVEEIESTTSSNFFNQKELNLKALTGIEIENTKDESLDNSKNANLPISENLEILGANQKVLVFFGVYLERDICIVFKLDKLNLLSPEKSKTALKGVSLLKIHTKSDSVRIGAFQIWKATFLKVPEDDKKNDEPDTWPELVVSFTLPSTTQKRDLETHCLALKEVTYKKIKLVYKPDSIRTQGGRKTII